MTSGRRGSPRYALLLALAVTSCERSLPAGDPARGQVMQDDRGRTVRLDPVTGEVTVVDPPPAEPTASAPRAAASSASARAPESTAAAPTPVEALPQPFTTPPTVTVQPATVDGVGACVAPGNVPARELITLTEVNAYIRPGRAGTPVAVLPPVTRVRTIGAEGDWFLVRFDVGPGGDRRAYVHCSELSLLEQ
jgi:hypothetical protein